MDCISYLRNMWRVGYPNGTTIIVCHLPVQVTSLLIVQYHTTLNSISLTGEYLRWWAFLFG